MSPRTKSLLDLRPSSLSQNANDVKGMHSGCPLGITALFFDGANLAGGARSLGGVFDYGLAVADLAMGRPWIGTAVVLVGRMSDGVARFMVALRRLGLTVITSRRQKVCGQSKVNDDIVLATEATCSAVDPRVEELVLVSGDGDLAPVCTIARRAGKRVTVAGFRRTVSHRLVREADEILLLDERHVITSGGAA